MLKEIFFPNKRNLAMWIVILLISSPPLLGTLSGSLVTTATVWPYWRTFVMGLYMLIYIVLGLPLQTPLFIVYFFLPTYPTDNSWNKMIGFVMLILNSYILASIVTVIGDSFKKKQLLVKDFVIYSVIWVLFIIISLVAYIGEIYLIDFILFIATVVVTLGVILLRKRYTKKLFTSLCILIILFSLGALGRTLLDFETNYCGKYPPIDQAGGKVWQDCHTNFNLFTALYKINR